jgi:hypothetical protein
MNLQPTSLTPSGTRKPYFDGWNTRHAAFKTRCAKCNARLTIPFNAILEGAWGWDKRFTPEEVSTIERFFQLEKGSLALSGGWPAIVSVTCNRCATQYIFYADFDEYRNSVYQIVAQGLATVFP